MSNFSLLIFSEKKDMSSRETHFTLLLFFIVLCLLMSWADSAHAYTDRSNEGNKDNQYNSLGLNPQLSLQIKIHAFLLWGSVGFLMPVGILVIRFASISSCGKNFNVLFYSHLILQIVAVMLAIAGAVLSVKKFDNSFDNMHQRIGLGLYGLILFQPMLGLLRPKRGVKLRSIWYFIHWLIGIVICIVGIVNIYIGLDTYHERTAKSMKLWIVLFTIEISFLGFVYMLQDRWSYVLNQGARLGDEQIRPTDNVILRSNSLRKLHELIS